MESVANQLPPPPDPLVIPNQRVEAASDFLSLCDGTGHPAAVIRDGGPCDG